NQFAAARDRYAAGDAAGENIYHRPGQDRTAALDPASEQLHWEAGANVFAGDSTGGKFQVRTAAQSHAGRTRTVADQFEYPTAGTDPAEDGAEPHCHGTTVFDRGTDRDAAGLHNQ